MSTEERLGQLEKELAAMKRELQTRALIIEDDQGNARIRLAVDEFGAALGMSDEEGKPRAGLRVLKDGPALFLSDENGKPRAGLDGKCPRHRTPPGAVAALGAVPGRQLKALLRELYRKARQQ